MASKIKEKIKEKFILAIIPARKGSLRLKNKLIKKIGKKKLIEFTLNAIQKSKKITKTILISNDEKIIKLCKKKNFLEIYNRPKKISKSNSPSKEYVEHAIKYFLLKNYFIPEYILILQPTTPFREFKDIDRAINIIYKKKIESLISVTEPIQDPSECIYINKKKKISQIYVPKKNNYHPSGNQQSRVKTFFIDGSIYLFKTTFFLKSKKFFDKNSQLMIMPKIKGIDINDSVDLEIANRLQKK